MAVALRREDVRANPGRRDDADDADDADEEDACCDERTDALRSCSLGAPAVYPDDVLPIAAAPLLRPVETDGDDGCDDSRG